MKSHEYAQKMIELANFMLSKPEFETRSDRVGEMFWFWQYKGQFIDAVRALGNGKKEYEKGLSGDVLFHSTETPEGTCLTVRVNRAAVCRKVQEEKWECEPLLSQEEDAQLTA